METDINRFRGKILGGFNRRDVSEYIEKLAGERNALRRRCRELEEQTAQFAQKTAQLQQLTARLQAENGELKTRAEAAEQERDALTVQAGEAQAAETALRDQMREELEAALREERARAERELDAQRELARKEAAAQAAAKLDEIGTLLDCVAADSARDARDARDRLESLCEGMEASAHATEEARRRYLALREELEQGEAAAEAEALDAVGEETGDAAPEICGEAPETGDAPACIDGSAEETCPEDAEPAPEAVPEAACETASPETIPDPAIPEENEPAAGEIPAADAEARIWTGEIPEE